jgi:sirohydrochlorin ferrochelatase
MSTYRHPDPSSPDELHWATLLNSLGIPLTQVGVIVVDHGSRRAESNEMLEQFAKLFQQQAPFSIVEPAHMELAEPSIAQAYSECATQGARLILVSPFFLLPGRHWTADIPNLVRQAARPHPHTRWLVAAPLGLHPSLPGVMLDRAERCFQRLTDPDISCDVCAASGNCQAALGWSEQSNQPDP